MNDQEKQELAQRVLKLKETLENYKKLWKELDDCTQAMIDADLRILQCGDKTLTLKDNFAEKNTVFRPAGVKRFEIEVI